LIAERKAEPSSWIASLTDNEVKELVARIDEVNKGNHVSTATATLDEVAGVLAELLDERMNARR
jgi:hypothetical protein